MEIHAVGAVGGEMLGKLVHKAFRVVRNAFSDKPEDELFFTGNTIRYVSDGKKGSFDVRKLDFITLDESILGMFGTSLRVSTSGQEILVRGLGDDDAIRKRDKAHKLKKKVAQEDALLLLKKRDAMLVGRHSVAHHAWGIINSDQYLSARQLEKWLVRYTEFGFLKHWSSGDLSQSEVPASVLNTYSYLKTVIDNPAAWRKKRNRQWVHRTMTEKRDLIKKLSKDPLTTRQIEAVLTNDNRVLAVAGAGTGKTATVVARVNYLIRAKMLKPSEILVLSFNKDVSEEIAARVGKTCSGVDVRTFHAQGLEILKHASGKKQIGSDQKIANLVPQILQDILDSKNKNLAQKVLSFVIFHSCPEPGVSDFKTLQEALRFSSQRDLKSLKGGDDKRSFKGHEVKSHQELVIADWLWLMGIDYEYEDPYREADTGDMRYRTYLPDFHIKCVGHKGVYLEHFGIDRKGNTAPYIDKDKYLSDMKWKRGLHEKFGTTLLETFSYQFSEGTIDRDLRRLFEGLGIELCQKSHEDLRAHQGVRTRLEGLSSLLTTALELFKGQKLSVDQIQSRFKDLGKRGDHFFEIFKEVESRYRDYLQQKKSIDFGDMIIEAAKAVESGRFESPYRAIIVDEFQDISAGRAWLIDTLLSQVDDSRLLCVGDDWQSIYRFSGSDLSLMTDYKENWKQAVRVDLDKTFRFNDTINQLATRFITRNDSQLKKKVEATRPHEGPAIHIVSSKRERVLQETLRSIEKKKWDASVAVLSRYNRKLPDSGLLSQSYKKLKIDPLTIHRSKGLQWDYVILQGNEYGRKGFPCEIDDDPLISVFLSDMESYENAEERRLFYVAITRAKHEVWLFADPGRPSTFIQELIRDPAYSHLITNELDEQALGRECPKCQAPVALKRNRQNGHVFLSCIYYPRCKGTIPGCPECKNEIPKRDSIKASCPNTQGCGWESPVCPKCSSGVVREVKGKFGAFWSCTNFPDCDWKSNERPEQKRDSHVNHVIVKKETSRRPKKKKDDDDFFKDNLVPF